MRMTTNNPWSDNANGMKDNSLNITICCARTLYNEVTEVMLFRNSGIRAEVIWK
jgi:hypothetical protein